MIYPEWMNEPFVESIPKTSKLIREWKKKRNGGSHTKHEWLELCCKYDYKCVRCGKQGVLTKDHIIPITRGGSDDISNIQPLCARCNSVKHARTWDFRNEIA